MQRTESVKASLDVSKTQPQHKTSTPISTVWDVVFEIVDQDAVLTPCMNLVNIPFAGANASIVVEGSAAPMIAPAVVLNYARACVHCW